MTIQDYSGYSSDGKEKDLILKVKPYIVLMRNYIDVAVGDI
jgi:hypothetical protein